MAKSKINLDVEYDLVAVIDGLPEAERKKFDMSVSLTDFLGREGLNQQVAKCNTKRGLVRALMHFLRRAAAGEKFCLHFICHGNRCGLYLRAMGEFISWGEFRAFLMKINGAMDGQLVVNMTSCEGLHGIKIVDPNQDDVPFFGLIGPKEKISKPDTTRASEMFYCGQLAGKTIPGVVDEINKFSAETCSTAL